MKPILFRFAVLSLLASLLLLFSCTSRAPTGASNNSTGSQAAKVASIPNDAWPLFRGDAQATGVAKGDLPEKLELLWRFTPPKCEFESTAVIADGMVYIAGLDGNLYAVELATGEQHWIFSTHSTFKASPGVYQGRVFIGDTDGRFYCVDAATGKELWNFDTGGEIDSSPNFHGNKVIFGSRDYNVYCLDVAAGKPAWKFESDYEVRCFCSLLDGRCYVGGCDQKLHVLDLITGKQLSEVEIDSPTGSAPAIFNGKIYLDTQSGEIVAIDAKLCKVLWRRRAEKNVSEDISSAAVMAEEVIVGSKDKHVRALDPKTGLPLWAFATKGRVDSSPVVVGRRVFVGSAEGRLYALDLKTGRKLWDYQTGGAILASPAVAAGRLVIGTTQGDLLCFGAK